ncbi:MAG: hypothetical protein JWS12_187 [Candidatus Saccharibacteria bacterium]|nr:hypothetical protein [Candidatus Saccharibacteria bacterium]
MSKEFDYSTLTYDDREAIHNILAETTVKHIDRFAGLFSPMKFDPAASPSQVLETVHLPPAPSKFEEIHWLADAANPTLAPYTREFFSKQQPFMGTIRHLLENSVNVTNVTTHVNIADVAHYMAGWIEAMEIEDWQERNALGISRGVTTIEAFGMAASEVVQKLGHVFLSFPRTPTTEGMKIDQQLVDTNNSRMRKEVKKWDHTDLAHRLPVIPKSKGKTKHLAWEGKTAEIEIGEQGKPERVRLGTVSDGTIDMVRDGIVVPSVIWDGDDPEIIIGDITRVTNREDVNRVQNWQRLALAHVLGLSLDAVTIGR